MDVAVGESVIDHPYLVSEPLMVHPLVCIMPTGHALAAKSLVQPADLDGMSFVSFKPEGPITGQHLAAIFEEHRARPIVAVIASVASTLCEFVAAGHGVSLVHPAMAKALGDRLVARPFEPTVRLGFRICRRRDSRNARLVDDFVKVAHEIGRRFLTDGEEA